jgi:hypothetical protein
MGKIMKKNKIMPIITIISIITVILLFILRVSYVEFQKYLYDNQLVIICYRNCSGGCFFGEYGCYIEDNSKEFHRRHLKYELNRCLLDNGKRKAFTFENVIECINKL